MITKEEIEIYRTLPLKIKNECEQYFNFIKEKYPKFLRFKEFSCFKDIDINEEEIIIYYYDNFKNRKCTSRNMSFTKVSFEDIQDENWKEIEIKNYRDDT